MAAIEALAALDNASRVTLVSDSRYLTDGIALRLQGWIDRGWCSADGRPVADRDLWERLRDEAERHEIAWTWCGSHRDGFHNEPGYADSAKAGPNDTGRINTKRSCT